MRTREFQNLAFLYKRTVAKGKLLLGFFSYGDNISGEIPHLGDTTAFQFLVKYRFSIIWQTVTLAGQYIALANLKKLSRRQTEAISVS